MKIKIFVGCLLSFIVLPVLSVGARSNQSFYYEGDGTVLFVNKNTGVKNSLPYRNADGSFNRAGLDQINKVMGVPAAQLGEDYSLRLISFLDYLQDLKIPGKTFTVTSGYRSLTLNNNLRKKGRTAGETSYHIDAMAADVLLPGYDLAKVQALWEEIRHLEFGGVGMYGGTSLHLDSGRPRFWTKETALPKDGKPQENRNIYLSIEKDIYEPGETLKLFFSGISQYPIGVKAKWKMNKGGDFAPKFLSTVKEENGCMILKDHKEARLIEMELPKASGKLHAEVEFCGPEYSQMPKSIESRGFEVR